MLFLMTGRPGHSKTLNTIKFVREDNLFLEKDDEGKNLLDEKGKEIPRPVYYHNIRGIKYENWTEIDDSQARDWYNLPDGAVIIFDECQDIFPPLEPTKEPPEHIKKMNTYRHKGFTIVLVTQHLKNVNARIRRLIEQHYHFQRVKSTNNVTRYQFDEATDTDNPKNFRGVESSLIKIDKKYFDAYTSSTEHNFKPNIPWKTLIKLGLSMAAIVALVLVVINIMTGFGPDSEETIDTENKKEKSSLFPTSIAKGVNGKKAITTEEYVSMFQPRVPDVPFSAPVYDDVVEIKSFPRPQCYRVESGERRGQCRCYTQQATPLDISYSACNSYVNGGYFDPTLEDVAIASRGRNRDREDDRFGVLNRPVVASLATQSKRPRSTFIPYQAPEPVVFTE